MDIALYRLVDDGKRGSDLKKAVKSIKAIDDCLGRVISYPETEFVCVTFKPEGAKKDRKNSNHGTQKKQNLRAHHVRVGRYFNLLDFCRNGRAVEEGIDLVPKNAESGGRAYCPIPEENCRPLLRRCAGPAGGRLRSDIGRTRDGDSRVCR